MYNASQDFHDAVANGNHQIALAIFDDSLTFFDNSDISVEDGIEFNDYFNTAEDLSIGQALSNNCCFTVLNYKHLLDSFEFGEFKMTIGVYLNESSYSQVGYAMVSYSGSTYSVHSDAPYVRKNGSSFGSQQPSFAPKSLLAYNGTLYCYDTSGNAIAYNISNGDKKTYTPNEFMEDKFSEWDGIGYSMTGNILWIYSNGIRKTYEFVPLGVFEGERPNVVGGETIEIDSDDRMKKFDEDIPTDSQLSITYPITIKSLLKKLCDYVGVPCTNDSFINSSATITSRPEAFDNNSTRKLLMWIAEAAGSNAKFDRDGVLQLVWLRSTTTAFDENNYSKFDPYWYKTGKVTKLYNRQTSSASDSTIGNGNSAYLIQDNPLLTGVS